MTRISSRVTFLYKRVFPVIWFGFLAFFVAAVVSKGEVSRSGATMIVVPAVMAVFGYVIMKKLLFDLADEVLDGGDFLLIKKGGEEHRVALADISNVSAATMMNPPRITLRLTGMSAAGSLGQEVVFSPSKPISLNPFAKNAVAEDLIQRVEQARSRRGG